MSYITEDEFKRRFVTLVIRWRTLPQERCDLNMLLISASLRLTPDRRYSEREINDELAEWAARFGANFGLDHAWLRRLLVDEGYLHRDAAGTLYEFTDIALPYPFDPAIKMLDLEEVLNDEWTARRLKMQQYQASFANQSL